MFAPNPQVDTALDDVVSNLDISIQPNLSLICIHLDKKICVVSERIIYVVQNRRTY